MLGFWIFIWLLNSNAITYEKTRNNRFIAISPQPNVYDFSFLSPCPTSGLMIYGKKDELVPLESISELDKRLSSQKGISVEFQSIPDANHFFSKTETNLIKNLNKYIKKETTLF